LILRQALKIRESIKNILSLTKLNKPDFKNTDISKVIKHAVSIVEKFSNFRNIQIVTSITKNLPNISADPSLLEQAFLNLLLISSDSLPNGGIINISADYSDEKKEVKINFNDAGKGIPENILQQIFNPTDNTLIQNFEKTGISLTVCKDIVELHEGKILVNSKPGTGTTVTILLPV
jgi:signal transduction histidine kinase